MLYGTLRLLLLSMALTQVAPAAPTSSSAAEIALLQGQADEAQRLLGLQLSSHPEDARAHLLLCRLLISEAQPDAATSECEAAASRAPQDSDTQLWLGRALGAKASAANPLAAFPLARRVHAAFERAVQLNPNSGPALSDLGEFYTQAPAIVGGGLEKARSLAARMLATQPVRAHRLLAQIAEHAGDLRTAEAEFRNAGQTPPALIDLAQFYLTHSQPDLALSTIQSALRTDRTHGPELVDAAHILTQANRASDLAERCLEQYLASPAKTDDAPAFRVHLQLARLLAARGDVRGAAAERNAARQLASHYSPHTPDGR